MNLVDYDTLRPCGPPPNPPKIVDPAVTYEILRDDSEWNLLGLLEGDLERIVKALVPDGEFIRSTYSHSNTGIFTNVVILMFFLRD